MQHMHMGVSGPGQQVNQSAMMGGMPPGVNPNAHAMQHLSAQQQALLHQQQMNQIACKSPPLLTPPSKGPELTIDLSRKQPSAYEPAGAGSATAACETNAP
jgi:hypothetical protein